MKTLFYHTVWTAVGNVANTFIMHLLQNDYIMWYQVIVELGLLECYQAMLRSDLLRGLANTDVDSDNNVLIG